MLSGCVFSCKRRAEERRDKDPRCDEYAARGDCDSQSGWMKTNCWTACDKLLDDQLSKAECIEVESSGGCLTQRGLEACRGTCMQRLQANLSRDEEGNCWYWATDGECGEGGQVDKQCSQVR